MIESDLEKFGSFKKKELRKSPVEDFDDEELTNEDLNEDESE